MTYPTFDIVFTVNDLECSTRINDANWELALAQFWNNFDDIDDLTVEILSINGEEPYEW